MRPDQKISSSFRTSDGHGAHVRAREGAARGGGPPQATEPGFGAEPQ